MVGLRRRILLPPLLVLLAGCGRDSLPEFHDFRFQSMGTEAVLSLAAADSALAAAARDSVLSVYDRVTSEMNTWDATSAISRLGAAPAGKHEMPAWLARCLREADAVRTSSGGAFDPTAEPLMRLWGFYRREGQLPAQAAVDSALSLMGSYSLDADGPFVTKLQSGTRFDLGGIAKGFAVDRAGEALGGLGIRDALIDLGGNLLCLGAPSGKNAWRVGIRDPGDKGRHFASLDLSDQAVATSGSYERFVTIDGRRYGHIMNPATGHPAVGLLSATVVSDQATLADALSTTLFVLGPEKARRLLAVQYPDVGAVLVQPEGDGARVLLSRNLRGRFTLLPDYEATYAVEFF